MNEYANTMLAERRPQSGFCLLSPEGLQQVAAELGLSLSLTALLRCREYFRLRERRDPTVGELRFLDAWARLQATLPASTLIESVTGSDHDCRTFADILRQGRTLLQEGEGVAMHLCGLQETGGQYLSRCGIPPYHKALKSGPVTEFSALAPHGLQAPTLVLDDMAAAVMPAPRRLPGSAALLLLSPTGRAPFAREVEDFFASHSALGLVPLAAPRDEGIFPHLMALGTGVTVDTAQLPHFDPDRGIGSLLSYGRGTILFAAPQGALPLFLGRGLPITLLGHQGAYGGRLILRHGELLTLTVEMGLLHALCPLLRIAPTIPDRTEQQLAYGESESGTTLFAGARVQGGCATAMLRMIGRLVAAGGDPTRMTATSILELPPMSEQTAADALPCLLDLHRVTCELAIPAHNHRQLICNALTAPRISVFIAAEKRAPRPAEFSAAWEAAMASQSFATMRSLLHPTK